MNLTRGITRSVAQQIIQKVIRKPIRFIHKKTGNMYFLLNDDLIECTNGREEKKYCLYANKKGMIFVRERDEFYQKFEKYE